MSTPSHTGLYPQLILQSWNATQKFQFNPCPKNVYLDTKIRISGGLEAKLIYSVGHFGKWLPLRSKGKYAMALWLKISL